MRLRNEQNVGWWLDGWIGWVIPFRLLWLETRITDIDGFMLLFKYEQNSRFYSVKSLAWKSVSVQFLTNFMSMTGSVQILQNWESSSLPSSQWTPGDRAITHCLPLLPIFLWLTCHLSVSSISKHGWIHKTLREISHGLITMFCIVKNIGSAR